MVAHALSPVIRTLQRSWPRVNRVLTTTLAVLLMVSCAAFLTAKFNRSRNPKVMHLATALQNMGTRPYAARPLVPALCNVIANSLPEGARLSIKELAKSRADVLIKKGGIEDRFIVPWAIMLGIHFLAYLGMILCVRRLLYELYDATPFAATIGAVLSGLAVQMLWPLGARFFYDPPTLVFGGLLTLLIVRGKDWAFLATLLVASANKETAVVYSVMWGICALSRSSPQRTVIFFVLQLLMAIGIRLAIIHFADLHEPTVRYDNYLRDYWEFNSYHLAASKMWIHHHQAVALIVAGMILLRKWSTHPLVIRASFVGVVILFVGQMRGGLWGEVRVFSDVYVPLAAAAAVNIVGIANSDPRPATLRVEGPPREHRLRDLSVYVGLLGLMLALFKGATGPDAKRFLDKRELAEGPDRTSSLEQKAKTKGK